MRSRSCIVSSWRVFFSGVTSVLAVIGLVVSLGCEESDEGRPGQAHAAQGENQPSATQAKVNATSEDLARVFFREKRPDPKGTGGFKSYMVSVLSDGSEEKVYCEVPERTRAAQMTADGKKLVYIQRYEEDDRPHHMMNDNIYVIDCHSRRKDSLFTVSDMRTMDKSKIATLSIWPPEVQGKDPVVLVNYFGSVLRFDAYTLKRKGACTVSPRIILSIGKESFYAQLFTGTQGVFSYAHIDCNSGKRTPLNARISTMTLERASATENGEFLCIYKKGNFYKSIQDSVFIFRRGVDLDFAGELRPGEEVLTPPAIGPYGKWIYYADKVGLRRITVTRLKSLPAITYNALMSNSQLVYLKKVDEGGNRSGIYGNSIKMYSVEQ